MTAWINIEANKWTKVTDGQCTLQKQRPEEVKVYIGNDTPDDTTPYGLWNYGEFSYGGSDSVWVKSKHPQKIVIFQ